MSVKVSSLLQGKECGKIISCKRSSLLQVTYLHIPWLFGCGIHALQHWLSGLYLYPMDISKAAEALLSPAESAQEWTHLLLSVPLRGFSNFTEESWDVGVILNLLSLLFFSSCLFGCHQTCVLFQSVLAYFSVRDLMKTVPALSARHSMDRVRCKASLSVFKTKQNHLNQQSPATFLLSLLVVPARWKACSGLGKTGMPEQQLRNSYWGFLAGRVSLLPTPSYSLMVTRFLCFRVCSAAFEWDWGAVGVCSQIFCLLQSHQQLFKLKGKLLVLVLTSGQWQWVSWGTSALAFYLVWKLKYGPEPI